MTGYIIIKSSSSSSIVLPNDFLGHKFEVHLIERPELRNAHEYDVFYEDFREEIGKIEKGMEPGDELLLNMASGTPAMKSSLMVIATFAEYYILSFCLIC